MWLAHDNNYRRFAPKFAIVRFRAKRADAQVFFADVSSEIYRRAIAILCIVRKMLVRESLCSNLEVCCENLCHVVTLIDCTTWTLSNSHYRCTDTCYKRVHTIYFRWKLLWNEQFPGTMKIYTILGVCAENWALHSVRTGMAYDAHMCK